MAAWTLKRGLVWTAATICGLMAVAAFAFRDDILFKGLDPQVPYQTYQPPGPPDYSQARSWALPLPGAGRAGPPPAPATSRLYFASRNRSGANTYRWFFQLVQSCPPLPST